MELSEKVLADLQKAADVFNTSYKNLEAKIGFLKNVYNDKNYPYSCEHKEQIKNALILLGKNAKEIETRKLQQKLLAPLMQMLMTNPNKEQLLIYFSSNNFHLSIFCLTYIHFQEDARNEKEKKAHEFLLKHLNEAVKKLVN